MNSRQTVWMAARVQRHWTSWLHAKGLLAVLTLSLIFGLQIVVLLQSTGGTEAYSMAAAEGMHLPK